MTEFILVFVGEKKLNITLSLWQIGKNDQMQEWWVVNQTEPGPIKRPQRREKEAGLELYVFSDQVSPPSLGFLAGYGYVAIVGLWVSHESVMFCFLSNHFFLLCKTAQIQLKHPVASQEKSLCVPYTRRSANKWTLYTLISFLSYLCRIMGLYASVVLVIGKFVREFFSGISHTIMFEELPNVDRILKLCTDIFLVRETGELDLEEDMYSKLIFLYRSPETMIKWTREKTQWKLSEGTLTKAFSGRNRSLRESGWSLWRCEHIHLLSIWGPTLSFSTELWWQW